jgi:hypothetical protein
MYNFLEKTLFDGKCFFDEAEMPDPIIRREVLEEEMSPLCIENWIRCGDSNITREQAGKILEKIPLLYTLHSLKKKGFMDSIDNGKGQEVFFLSEKGKAIGKELWEERRIKENM